MSKFNLKLAGQYSNNLSNLINELMINPFTETDSLFTIKELHQKSKIKVGNEELNFQDEEIEREKTGRFKDITLEQRLKLIKDLVNEKAKIDSIISQKVKESKIKSVFTGEEIDIDLAKQENVLYKTKLLPSFEHVSKLSDEKSKSYGFQPVGFGDSISDVKYSIEITKTVDVDKEFVENEKLDILKKLDEQSMLIDKIKTNSEFEFDNAYDIRETLNKLISSVKN